MERFFTNEYFINRKNEYLAKDIWFDSQYHFVLLAIMYKNLWFYCYSEDIKDIFVCKFDEIQLKVVAKKINIYHLVHYNKCVCLLHCNTIILRLSLERKIW